MKSKELKLEDYNEFKYKQYIDSLNYWQKRELMWDKFFKLNFTKFEYDDFNYLGLYNLGTLSKNIAYSMNQDMDKVFKFTFTDHGLDWKKKGYGRRWHCIVPFENHYNDMLRLNNGRL